MVCGFRRMRTTGVRKTKDDFQVFRRRQAGPGDSRSLAARQAGCAKRERREQHRSSEVQIMIDVVPPSDQGGPDTHADIAGKVSGKVSPDYMVAIYARAYGEWFIQPQAGFLHPLKPDNTWTTWTHTGTRYAALLVRPDFEPLTRLDMLPATDDYVLALEIVDGVPKQQSTNSASGALPSAQ